MSARWSVAFVALLSVLAGCKPSPDEIAVSSTTHPLLASGDTTLAEGDLIVVDTRPLDDSEDMDLCVTASSSAPNVVSVLRVRDKCRVFVLSGKTPGRATVTFHARDGSSTRVVDVTSP